jgi:hypothetical protein
MYYEVIAALKRKLPNHEIAALPAKLAYQNGWAIHGNHWNMYLIFLLHDKFQLFRCQVPWK